MILRFAASTRRGGVDVAVAQELLQRDDVGAGFEQVRGVRMAQAMEVARLASSAVPAIRMRYLHVSGPHLQQMPSPLEMLPEPAMP